MKMNCARVVNYIFACAVIVLLPLLGGCLNGTSQSVHARSVRGLRNPSTIDPELRSLADRIRDNYRDEKYIAFTSVVDVHESLAPGWVVRPGKGIAPDAAFDVVMSARGDINSKLRYGSRLVYEFQFAVRERDGEEPTGAREYVVKEYDHARGIRMEEQISDEPMRSMILSHEALKPSEWCASGGTVVTFVGPMGRVADRDYETSYAEEIERGRLIGTRELLGYGQVDVIKWVYQEAAGRRKGPAGQDLDPSPAVWWYTFVDRERELIVGSEGYFEFPGREPVILRRKRFENIRFPAQVDHRVFTDVPEYAKDYRVWKPGTPYPTDGETDESDTVSAASEASDEGGMNR